MATKKIRSANAAPMSILAPDLPRTGTSNGTEYKLSLVHADSLSPGARDTIYELFDSNMSTLQQSSSFPYTEQSKREELFHPDTRYLILSNPPTTISTLLRPIASLAERSTVKGKGKGRREEVDIDRLLGFCSFRFDTEETLTPRDAEVVYCYELQLAPSSRGSGLGALLISHLEEIGRRQKLDKVMLTCLKRNQSALSFYIKQGYTPDEIDPTRMAEDEEWADDDSLSADGEEGDAGDDGDSEDRREVDYVILSKGLV